MCRQVPPPQAGANVNRRPSGGATTAMVMLAESVDAVIGVDTHTDTHTACLLDNTGREIATITIEATPAGYAALLGAGAGSRSPPELGGGGQIGRASCRETVWIAVWACR